MKSSITIVIVLLSAFPAQAATKTFSVASDGSGDFKTPQEAVAAAPENTADRTVIRIKPGTYEGQMIVPKDKPNFGFVGEDAATTLLTWPHNVKDPIAPGADGFNPGVQILGDGFTAENLTFQNTSGDHGQALALRVDADRAVFKNCRIVGWQDTLMVNSGRQYFQNCYIAGRVDFIYGSATAVFDRCEIHSRNGGHVTAASTPQDHLYGFVFINCQLTGDNIPWTPPEGDTTTSEPPKKPNKFADLGRPWRPYASVAYIHCQMDDHIKPEGWNNWGRAENEKTARYAEYQSTGPGANPEKRAAWTKQLTDAEAAEYTIEKILGGSDHWNPVMQ
ncbi:MAG TPA: pectinesterase family protein [Pirellulales bacterium]|nr:pectinesterase family protein [Pirellulales bacterium]